MTLHPARRELVEAGGVRPLLLLVAAAVAIPLIAYGVDQGLIEAEKLAPEV